MRRQEAAEAESETKGSTTQPKHNHPGPQGVACDWGPDLKQPCGKSRVLPAFRNSRIQKQVIQEFHLQDTPTVCERTMHNMPDHAFLSYLFPCLSYAGKENKFVKKPKKFKTSSQHTVCKHTSSTMLDMWVMPLPHHSAHPHPHTFLNL